jgi:hypothetical protein
MTGPAVSPPRDHVALARAVAAGTELSIGSLPQLLDAAVAAGRAGTPARVLLSKDAGSALAAIAQRLSRVGRVELCG